MNLLHNHNSTYAELATLCNDSEMIYQSIEDGVYEDACGYHDHFGFYSFNVNT